jgi:Pyruvate/2-oxoacid:ferredoxin oxidoreductase gamma subunit
LEHEIIITGIGGQGIQLAGQILARAAIAEEREVMMLGTYGGTMRGGNTESTVIIGDGPLISPPIVSHVGTALVMHHQFWKTTQAKLRPRALVVINSSLFEGELDRASLRVVEIPATQRAADAGSPLAASLVLLGAYARATEIVGLPALMQGLRESLPSYRTQHLPLNEEALRLGYEPSPATCLLAWSNNAETGANLGSAAQSSNPSPHAQEAKP